MYCVESNNDEMIISKSRMMVLPKNEEVKKILILEEEQSDLKKVIKNAQLNKKSIEHKLMDKDLFNFGMGFFNLMVFGGFDIALTMTLLTTDQFKISPIPCLVANNIALGSAIFIAAKNQIKLDKQKKNVQVQFDKLEETINNEIQRKAEQQQDVVGDDVALTSVYVKMKSL